VVFFFEPDAFLLSSSSASSYAIYARFTNVWIPIPSLGIVRAHDFVAKRACHGFILIHDCPITEVTEAYTAIDAEPSSAIDAAFVRAVAARTAE
jgi:hypothetical protein